MSGELDGDDAEVLEISEDAVRAWVAAWREFAESLRSLGEDAKWQSEAGVNWGDLDSIRQLERIYREHLGGGLSSSLAGRLAEFSEESQRISNQVESNFLALTDQDFLTARALENNG